ARDGADIVSLPMECVKTDGEPIPGPITRALAERAARHRMYVVGNLREKEGARTYVTSVLYDRAGKLVGKYRKSHKMPDEEMDLGDDLPVFETDFGKIGLRIGSDRFFPDIDHVYTAKGAGLILWAQQPEPVEDEFSQDFPSEGRATDYNVNIACSRYATAGQGWITNMYPPYCGMPIGRAYVINREGQRVACTPRTGGGVAIAAIPLSQMGPGRQANPKRAFAALTAPVRLPEKRAWAKRKVRVTAIEAHLGIEELLKALDEAGRIGSDIACTYELVWIAGPDKDQIARDTEVAKRNLARVAEKAKQYGMYVLIAGVVDRIERNEAILFGRDGQEVGRYFKIAKTHDEMIPGDDTPVFETDFGRVAARICADEWMVELDRCYGIKGVDILFTPTQSWGPDALFRDQRDLSRAMDAGFFLVEVTHPSSEVRHRSLIADPTGVVVARSEYRTPRIVSAVIDLDNDRPLRYIRDYQPHTPGGYLPEYQPDRMPAAANDLRETILRQRRPELYGVLSPEAAAARRPEGPCGNPTFRDWGAPEGLWDLLRYG
ncbi:MAG: carbon-nitrogen hydrolase family protein, partial [Armatimonadetes bacterium]|nr:carbon-nitrogen hydrolase family protein [Armatimonadota bacterium]